MILPMLLICVAWIPLPVICLMECHPRNSSHLQFHLVRECQRAAHHILALENTPTFADCAELAREWRGLALNYSPGGKRRSRNRYAQQFNESTESVFKYQRSQLSVFEQPAEFFNCHVLQCPQNASFSAMINDSRFDYYSLYGRPVALQNYSCVPEVGLFLLYTEPTKYTNASLACSNSSEFIGSLAHVASERRTDALSRFIFDYNKRRSTLEPTPGIFLAYVGLQYNRTTALNIHDFRNAQNESLSCFLYRAWDVGHPRRGTLQSNASCVALTPHRTWQTVSCVHKLPYICEIFTTPTSSATGQLDVGPNAVAECQNN